MSVGGILDLLRARFGLDPATHGAGAIETAIRSAMERAGFSDSGAYLQHVESDAAGFEALASLVLVPETWFFRYPRSFELLAERALALPAGHVLRVLCVPCSTGEEPYSVAMTLLDRGFDPASLRIVAVDVSPSVVERARGGRYGRNSFRGAADDVVERHGSWDGDTYVVGAAVRRVIEWRPGSVLDAAVLATGAPYDFVFFRNLLIYLGNEERRRALEVIASVLSPGGWLLSGHGELGILSRFGFQPAGAPAAFAAQLHATDAAETRPPHPPPHPPSHPPSHPTPQPAPRPMGRPTPRPTPRPTGRPTGRPGSRAPAPANASRSPRGRPATTPLDEAERAANGGHLDRARELCEAHLRAQPGAVRAHYLLGVVLASLDDDAGARRSLERAVYLDPDHHEALVLLALGAEARGDAEAASAWHRRAARALERQTTGGAP